MYLLIKKNTSVLYMIYFKISSLCISMLSEAERVHAHPHILLPLSPPVTTQVTSSSVTTLEEQEVLFFHKCM